MRAIWTGTLSFGLLAIPVKLFSATESKQEVSFHLLHKTDLAPVRYERVCTADGKKLGWDEVVKGYEYEKGKYAVVGKEELAEAVQEETSDDVPVLEFVARGDIDPMSFEKPYFLAPAKGGERAYSVMREALAQEDKVAIVRITLRKRPHLAAVHPEQEALALTMLRTADDLRSISELDLSTRTPGEGEVKAARALVAKMTTEWSADQYRDEYRERIEALIKKKMPKHRALHAPAKGKAKAAEEDLLDVLTRSLESSHKPAANHQGGVKKGAAKKTATAHAKSERTHVRAAAKRPAKKKR